MSLFISATTSIVLAQQTAPTTQEATSKPEQKIETKAPTPAPAPKEGWFPKLGLGINLSLAHSNSVPGVDDGLTLSLGIMVTGELLYLKDQHEWKSNLSAAHTQTKTPTIEPFVKTADTFDLRSFYTYRFKNAYKLGVFGGLELNTPLFPTYLVVAADTRLSKLRTDGSKEGGEAKKNEQFFLLDPFNPLIFKQKLGVEAIPVEDTFAKLSLKTGLTVQQVWARGFTVQDDPVTPELEIKELQDYVQLGLELNIALTGDISQRVSYAFVADFMLPFITNIPTTLQGFELLNADLSFKVSVKLVKWASLDYVFRALRTPLLVDKWQVTNNLLLSIKADFI
jgi:hypothetical protein